MRLSLAIVLAGIAATALAFDSTCYFAGAPCAEGPQAARGRWIGDGDEHRRIFEMTRQLAGLPPAASDPFTLRVFTDGHPVDVAGTPSPTVRPVDFASANFAVDRPGPSTPGEFAQLPDWSYSLWDWILGNETCPLDGSDVVDPFDDCHSFQTHMGPVNSNHFLPQAGDFYRYYHALAVQRARDCDAAEQRAGSHRADFHDFFVACEQEALVLEAISHHFLQDAWSMGHMWERWGSPDPVDFYANQRGAIGLAGLSGLIHGARSLLQGKVGWIDYDIDDAMCAPSSGIVAWRRPDTADLQPAVGDEYLGLLLAGQYPAQYAELFSCTVASLREVYDVLTMPELGAATPADPSLAAVSPAACFAQRATNLAMQTGGGLDYTLNGTQQRFPLDSELLAKVLGTIATRLAPTCAPGSSDPTCQQFQARLQLDLIRVAAMLDYWATTAPHGIQAASGGLPDFLGFQPNSYYAGRSPLASYIDPPLPWPSSGIRHAGGLARGFHRAHAGDWCVVMDAAYLNALRTHVTATAAAGGRELAVATEICAEFVQRHTRPWSAAGPLAEPLCEFAASRPDQVPFIDELGTSSLKAASTWCTCGDGAYEADKEDCDPSAPGGDVRCPGLCSPVGHARTIGDKAVLDQCTCPGGAMTRYTYQGNRFCYYNGGYSCSANGVGECQISGSFVLPFALPPNINGGAFNPYDVTADVSAFSFTDGAHTITQDNAGTLGGGKPYRFAITSTDPNGNITGWGIGMQSLSLQTGFGTGWVPGFATCSPICAVGNSSNCDDLTNGHVDSCNCAGLAINHNPGTWQMGPP